ncbi:MAG: hypothetical protein ACH346_01150 [Chthoniobacterales bacterium]
MDHISELKDVLNEKTSQSVGQILIASRELEQEDLSMKQSRNPPKYAS